MHEWEEGRREREEQTPRLAGSPARGSIQGPRDHDLSPRQPLIPRSHPGISPHCFNFSSLVFHGSSTFHFYQELSVCVLLKNKNPAEWIWRLNRLYEETHEWCRIPASKGRGVARSCAPWKVSEGGRAGLRSCQQKNRRHCSGLGPLPSGRRPDSFIR